MKSFIIMPKLVISQLTATMILIQNHFKYLYVAWQTNKWLGLVNNYWNTYTIPLPLFFFCFVSIRGIIIKKHIVSVS